MLSRITGMVRDIVLAFAFGTNEALAALFVAFRLSHVCRRLFGEGALQSAFIPLFEEARKDDEGRAFRFFRDVSALLSLFLAGFVAVGTIALLFILSFMELSPGNREIIFLMILLLPSLFPICLFGLNASLLQCQKHYFTVGVAPAGFNLFITITALLLNGWPAPQAMPYLAISIVLGCTLQWWITLPQTLRHARLVLSSSLLKGIKFFSPDVKKLFWPLFLGILGVGASQINNAVDALYARAADPEGPAQLWYGLRLQQLPMALFGIALSGALLPPLSRSIHAGNKKEYLHFLDFALRRVFALLYGCTLYLLVVGMTAINTIFGRGDFQAHSVITTTGCLHGYCLGLVPMGCIIVLAPAFYARRDYITPTKGAAISLISNVLLNGFFVYILGWGAISVALSTSISSILNGWYLAVRLKGEFGQLLPTEGKREAWKMVKAATLGSLVSYLLISWIHFPPLFFTVGANYVSTRLPTGFVSQISALTVQSLVFLFCFLGAAWIFKAKDILHVFKTSEQGDR